MTRFSKKVFASIIVPLYLFGLPLVAMAQTTLGTNTDPTTVGTNSDPTTPGTNAVFVLSNPLGGQTTTLCQLIRKVLDVTIQLATPIIVVFLVIAGFRFVAARGNSQALEKAKANLLWTIVGIAIFLGAYTLALVLSGTIRQLQDAAHNYAGSAC